MPTLLQINVSSNWGSTGKIAEQIGLCAQSHGWECYVAFGRSANPSALKNIKVGNMFWTVEHFAENRLLDNEGLASRIPTKRFLKEIDKIHPDVVHLHNIHDHYINYRLLFSYLAKKKIPVVWTQHDLWAITGHCMYIPDGCVKWNNVCNNCQMVKRCSLDRSRRNHQLKKRLLATIPSLTIVPVSEWLADNMRQSHLKNRPIEVIHNGIDIKTFSPQTADVKAKFGIGSKKIVLGVAAVWDARKGLKDFYALSQMLPKDEYEIVIVGKVDSAEKKFVDGGCEITFVDRTENVLELAQLYSDASVFANPTYQDNYPTTNLEAMACGTPVVTYRTGGSPEAVDENTGLVIDQGDVEALKDAVIELSSKDMREACRKRAEAIFDKEKCFSTYISLYNKLLTGGGKIMLLGVAAVWDARKGLQDYIALSKILPPEYIIVLIGLNKEQIESLPDNMVGIGRTQNQAELAAYYSMADILLSLSTGETFGMTMAEAYGCGTPVIVYDNTAQPEIVTPETGRVVKTSDIEALAATIREFRDIDFKKHHTSACRKRAEECFDKDKCFERYVELYEALLER